MTKDSQPSSSSTTPSPLDDERLERVFDYISKGKTMKSEGQLWTAAVSFWEARNLLRELANNNNNSNNNSNSNSNSNNDSNDEVTKIQRLYQDQCREYFHKTRTFFLQALQQEHDEDVKQQQQRQQQHQLNNGRETTSDQERTGYRQDYLSDQEATQRIQLFSSLFAKELLLEPPHSVATHAVDAAADHEVPMKDQNGDDNIPAAAAPTATATNNVTTFTDGNDNYVDSLEERLKSLNASIPQGFKSSQERISDINLGMKRLGLPNYYYNNNKIEPPKSASQQVEDIIAQAKDEVAMGLVADSICDNDNANDDVDASESVANDMISSIGSDDGADSILSDEVPELQNVDKIKDQVAEAQAKLAELTALLDTLLPSSVEEEDDEEAELDVNPPTVPLFENVHAKQMLQDARRSIGKALTLWKVKPKTLS